MGNAGAKEGETSLCTAGSAAVGSADQGARSAADHPRTAPAAVLVIAVAGVGLPSFLAIVRWFRHGLKMVGRGVDGLQAILTRSVGPENGKKDEDARQKGGWTQDFHRGVPRKVGIVSLAGAVYLGNRIV
jgi:hypothetical protein